MSVAAARGCVVGVQSFGARRGRYIDLDGTSRRASREIVNPRPGPDPKDAKAQSHDLLELEGHIHDRRREAQDEAGDHRRRYTDEPQRKNIARERKTRIGTAA